MSLSKAGAMLDKNVLLAPAITTNPIPLKRLTSGRLALLGASAPQPDAAPNGQSTARAPKVGLTESSEVHAAEEEASAGSEDEPGRHFLDAKQPHDFSAAVSGEIQGTTAPTAPGPEPPSAMGTLWSAEEASRHIGYMRICV